MPVNLDALLRYHTINYCLQQRGKKWTWEELARACAIYADEVAYRQTRNTPSKRTIQNDIKVMRSPDLGYNAPIASSNGKYFYTEKDYSIKNITLNQSDIQNISLALKVLGQYKGFDFFNDLNQIFEKFESRLQLRFNQQFQQNIAFEQLPVAKGTVFLKPFIEAINQKNTLQISYHKFNTEHIKTYIIHPYLLKEYNNRWYLLGHSQQRNAITTFALDRVESFDMLPNLPFVENKSFNAQAYFSDTIGITYSGEKPQQLVIKVEIEFSPYLITKPLHHSQRLVNKDELFYTFSYLLVINQELENLLMSHINHLIIVEPKVLKDSLKEKIEKALKNFS